MDADILVVMQAGEDGVGDASDAHLQASAVFDKLGTIATDGLFHLVGLRHVDGEQGSVILNEDVDAADMNECIAESARHMLVDYSDDELGVLHGCQGGVDGRA